MPVKGPISLVTSHRHIRRRVGDLEAVVTAELREPYKAEVQPDGSVLLVLERTNAHSDDIVPDYKSGALRVVWRMRSLPISLRDMIYLLQNLDCSVSLADVAPWWTRLSDPASQPVTILEGSDEMRGAYRPFSERLELMYEVRALQAPDTMQTGGSRYTWVTIGVDGTNRGIGGMSLCSGWPVVWAQQPRQVVAL